MSVEMWTNSVFTSLLSLTRKRIHFDSLKKSLATMLHDFMHCIKYFTLIV